MDIQTQKKKNEFSNNSGKNHLSWKGNNASYRTIHSWVKNLLGKASDYKCIDCGKPADHWSNVDHLYKRILEDYSPRCRKCHYIYDKKFNNSNARKEKIMKTKKGKKLFSVFLTDELHLKLKIESVKKSVSMNDYIVEAITKELKNEK